MITTAILGVLGVIYFFQWLVGIFIMCQELMEKADNPLYRTDLEKRDVVFVLLGLYWIKQVYKGYKSL